MNRAVPILAITVLALTASALARGEDGGGTVQGGGTTIIAGGTGAPSFVPVITKLAFHWRNGRSEEHTSELQSRVDLVCRLLLEKKKTTLPTDDPIQATIQYEPSTRQTRHAYPPHTTGHARQ